jgi:hypothetical protein
MAQPGDGPWFVPASTYVSSELPRTTLCRDAGLAWPSSSRLPGAPTAPAATPAWARRVDGDGDRAPIERRPPRRGGEQRITGDARRTPHRIELSKDSDLLIGGASYGAENKTASRWERPRSRSRAVGLSDRPHRLGLRALLVPRHCAVLCSGLNPHGGGLGLFSSPSRPSSAVPRTRPLPIYSVYS